MPLTDSNVPKIYRKQKSAGEFKTRKNFKNSKNIAKRY